MKILKYLIYGCIIFVIVKFGFLMVGIMNGDFDSDGVSPQRLESPDD